MVGFGTDLTQFPLKCTEGGFRVAHTLSFCQGGFEFGHDSIMVDKTGFSIVQKFDHPTCRISDVSLIFKPPDPGFDDLGKNFDVFP